MTYARIVQSDNSQAERLPKEFRQGNDIVLRERPISAVDIFDVLTALPSDFMAAGRVEDLLVENWVAPS